MKPVTLDFRIIFMSKEPENEYIIFIIAVECSNDTDHPRLSGPFMCEGTCPFLSIGHDFLEDSHSRPNSESFVVTMISSRSRRVHFTMSILE